MDREDTVTEAIAIAGGKIVELGKSETLRRLAGRSTRILDLRGRLVTPGLIDSHCHFAEAGIDAAFVLDLRYPKTKNVQNILELVGKKAKRSGRGKWIIGSGWNETLLEEKRYLTRWELDSVSPDNPVLLRHVTGHCIVVNSLALRLPGISKQTPDPPSGSIERDSAGEPTGVLKEFAAMNIVLKLVPQWTIGDWINGIRHATRLWVREGVTAVKESYSRDQYRSILAAYRSLMSSRKMKIRSYLLLIAETVKDLNDAIERQHDFSTHTDDILLKLGGIKVIFDGSLVARTAWMYEEYCDATGKTEIGNRGYPALREDEMTEIVTTSDANGFQIAVHAIGDRAIDVVLDAYEKALKTNPRPDHRHSIVHALIPKQDAVRRMSAMNLVVETQTSFLYFLADGYSRSIRADLLRRVIPIRTLLDAGITVGNGSDAPYGPYPPRYGLWAACTRRSYSGREGEEFLGKGECISIREALRTYTIDAAKCLEMEDNIGSLERGKLADLVVWEKDILSIPIDEVREVRVVMTIIDGKVAFQRRPNNRVM
jgi:predicted amidohydrolase YtcJ